ncbi:MAG: hypothetical protein HY688_03335 [Chloroflexi bacterium]|nr:hypothetical protein [Chloroflexota bacterium]
MPNVRLDQNGVPMGPVYEPTAPAVHRSGVTAVDAADPADASGAVDCAGYEYCRFDVSITGTGLTSLEVQALFWNSRQALWFGGARRTFTATGRYAVAVPDVRGARVFLKVTAFSGTSFSLSADYSLS